jgi:tetratricopeptide (TPR) repeat protein
MGTVYSHQGDYAKALEHHEKALKIQISVLGQSHPSVARTLCCQSETYIELGKFTEAETLASRALDIWEKTHTSSDHVDCALALDCLGRGAYMHSGALAVAEERLRKSLAIWEKAHANTIADHPAVATSLLYLGECLVAKGDVTPLATETLERAMRIVITTLGAEHPTAAKVHIALARAHAVNSQQRTQHASTAMRILHRVFGDDSEHPRLADARALL